MSSKNSICLVCNRKFGSNYGVARHYTQTHNLSRKEYYDTYLKKDDKEGLCAICGNETELRYNGYREFCSHKCVVLSGKAAQASHTPEAIALRTVAHKQTLKDNPEIMKARETKRLQTLKDNPEIMQNSHAKRQQTFKANPEIEARRAATYSQNIKDNPEIMKVREIKRQQTLKNNPEIALNSATKYKQTLKDNPEIVKNRTDKISIILRTTYNKLFDKNSIIPYHLYIVKNSIKDIVKIGVSTNPKRRLFEINTAFGSSEIVYTVENKFHKISELELYLHDHFTKYCQVQPTGGGRTEWFDGCILDEAISLASSYNFN